MKFDTLEDLINHIMLDIMENDYDRYLRMEFGQKEILMFVFETEIPIRITKQQVYSEDQPYSHNEIFAEVYAELLRTDIGKGWLLELDKICKAIDENSHIFEKLIKLETL